jgi:hypothetical protein
MNHIQVQEIATKHGFGQVYFQFNVSQNTGREFEVGYVSVGGRRSLFCKRGPNTNPDQFYLCNEYEKLKTEMSKFMTLREFLLLKDPLDSEPKRSIFRNDLPFRNIYSAQEQSVMWYDIAKTSWDLYGAEGPPIGCNVEMLQAGHGGDAGVIRTFEGVYDDNFFSVSRMENGKKEISLVYRKTWFVSMRVFDEKTYYR